MEQNHTDTRITAFRDETRLTSGPAWEVALFVKRSQAQDTGPHTYLCINDRTGRVVDLDLTGSDDEIVARLKPAAPADPLPQTGPGRPKLGVVGREVTLLPRHWEWLAQQPGGASPTLRKLVEAARKENAEADRIRAAQTAANAFMLAMLCAQPGYEEVSRALFRGDKALFATLTQAWPQDLRDHLHMLAAPAFGQNVDEAEAET